MFGSFLPSLWSFTQPQSTRVEEPTLLCNQVGTRINMSRRLTRHLSKSTKGERSTCILCRRLMSDSFSCPLRKPLRQPCAQTIDKFLGPLRIRARRRRVYLDCCGVDSCSRIGIALAAFSTSSVTWNQQKCVPTRTGLFIFKATRGQSPAHNLAAIIYVRRPCQLQV